MKANGRSTLIHAGEYPALPHRGLLRRFSRLLVIVAILAGIVSLFAWRLIPLDQPWRQIYILHDKVYLPLRAEVWDRHWPFSLVWVIPTIGLILFALTEWLGLFAAIRWMQRSAVRGMIASGLGRRIISTVAHLPYIGRLSFTRAVLDAEVIALRDRMMDPNKNPSDRRVTTYILYARFRASLARTESQRVLLALEPFCLARWKLSDRRAESRTRSWAAQISDHIKAFDQQDTDQVSVSGPNWKLFQKIWLHDWPGKSETWPIASDLLTGAHWVRNGRLSKSDALGVMVLLLSAAGAARWNGLAHHAQTVATTMRQTVLAAELGQVSIRVREVADPLPDDLLQEAEFWCGQIEEITRSATASELSLRDHGEIFASTGKVA